MSDDHSHPAGRRPGAVSRKPGAAARTAQPDLEVVGEAANGQAALQQVATLRPHVVLMDLRMPVLDGVAATRQLRAGHPSVQVIALTTFDDDADVFAALRAGAIGYLLKDVSGETLFAAARRRARRSRSCRPRSPPRSSLASRAWPSRHRPARSPSAPALGARA